MSSKSLDTLFELEKFLLYFNDKWLLRCDAGHDFTADIAAINDLVEELEELIRKGYEG